MLTNHCIYLQRGLELISERSGVRVASPTLKALKALDFSVLSFLC